MNKNSELSFDYIIGSTAYAIWGEINSENKYNINTIESMNNLISFFEIAITKNIIIEYDTENDVPIFSEDDPQTVSKRIFSDFLQKNPNFPENSPLDNDDFVTYLIYKTGWAVLYNGTKLVLPEN